MKKLIASASVAALVAIGAAALPGIASAGILEGAQEVQGALNNQTAPVTQLGAAVDINVGAITDSNIGTEVSGLSNVISQEVDVDQTGLINLDGSVQSGQNNSFAPVVQAGLAVTGQGSVTRSTVRTAVSAVNNAVVQTATVLQR